MNINTIHVCGNLTRDPEIKALARGGSVASFGIATNRAVKKPDGSKGEETEFHHIVVFGKLAETVGQPRQGQAVPRRDRRREGEVRPAPRQLKRACEGRRFRK